NGYTLARKVAFESLGWDVDTYVPELGCTAGAALLRPTLIYVDAAMTMLQQGLRVKAFMHVTGDGFLNFLRTERKAGF
ncbi:phosphoribosylformylglycinamidine cyclo-ligase, partial [Listeria monocytogenes]